MGPRRYYSARKVLREGGLSLGLPELRQMLRAVYEQFDGRDYFQEHFGYFCVDAGPVVGKAGSDVGRYFFLKLRKQTLWPIAELAGGYTEDDVFDVIELLYDSVSRPVEGRYHGFNDCGYHYDTFDPAAGRAEFREQINTILSDYRDGYELSEDGEILQLAAPGLENLLEAQLPKLDPANVEGRVAAAIRKFRGRDASGEDRRDAVRSLADVLEYLKPRLGTVLTKKDESDLFNIANNFGLRHHNAMQKNDYDEELWLPWMFYFYLSTIHVVARGCKRALRDNKK